ncbi:OmpH family outer membrane protein [Flavobacterium lindanitolerans]|nr:OmpH family outer membrane protein [Flavobacterium lindanitolerans]
MNAQAKTAHVDVSEIMAKMPAMIEGQKQLEKLNQTYNADYKTMVDEYQAKLKKYDAESSTVAEKVNQDRAVEIQDMQKESEITAKMLKKNYNKKSRIYLSLSGEKIKAAIQKVGKAKGYQYVLDSAMVLLADGPNITADVKKNLGSNPKPEYFRNCSNLLSSFFLLLFL